MTPPDPARYADGCLDPTARRALDPVPPTPADWQRVGDGIARRVLPRPRPAGRRGRRLAASLALAACALFAVLIHGGPQAPDPPPRTPPLATAPTDPLAEFAVLPVATDDEMRIATLRGDWGTGLVVGLHPLEGELRLATAGEVTVGRAPVGMDPVPDVDDEPMVIGFHRPRASE